MIRRPSVKLINVMRTHLFPTFQTIQQQNLLKILPYQPLYWNMSEEYPCENLSFLLHYLRPEYLHCCGHDRNNPVYRCDSGACLCYRRQCSGHEGTVLTQRPDAPDTLSCRRGCKYLALPACHGNPDRRQASTRYYPRVQVILQICSILVLMRQGLGINLFVNVIFLWNTVYLSRAVDYVYSPGRHHTGRCYPARHRYRGSYIVHRRLLVERN